MNKFFNLFIYYFLIFLGLVITSWIIWSRFIRERTIRDIPDTLLTEYRFWILLYICFIYFYVIKNLIKPKEANPFIKEIINIIYKPLITLDHFFKYNKKIKVYYYKFMINLIVKYLDISKITDNSITIIIFFMQVFPRIILVIFLILDTFYFKKIEIFYKIVLIGVLPFIYRYIKYTIKDIYEKWISELEDRYKGVRISAEKISNDVYTFKETTNAPYHKNEKTIKEFLDIKLQNMFDYYGDKVDYEYSASAISKSTYIQQYIYEKYKSNKENYKESKYKEEFLKTFGNYKHLYTEDIIQKRFEKFIAKKYIFDHYKPFVINEIEINRDTYNEITFDDLGLISSEDFDNLRKFYKEIMPSLISLKLFFFRLEYISEYKIIRWSKIIIFSLYFICWLYILIISYSISPVELIGAKYFLINLIRYLLRKNEPFSDSKNYSKNKNLFTKTNIKKLINKILRKS